MGNLSFRAPEAPVNIVPTFKYDHTPIPNYFLEQVLPDLVKSGRGLFTVALFLWLARIINDTGQEKIIISTRELANKIGASLGSTQRAIKALQELGVLEVTKLQTANNNEPGFSYRLINRVNYKKQGY